MKGKTIVLITILILSIAAMKCSKSNNPFAPESLDEKQTGVTALTVTGVATLAEEELQVQIRPHKWNKAWKNSDGFVTARIKGEGFDNIDPASVKMVGPEGSEITPYRTHTDGAYFKAKFYKKEAIAIIPDPKRNDKHEIQVIGNLNDGTAFLLVDEIIIEGKKSAELSLKVSPKNWNTNWTNKDGNVTAKIKGEGFDSIVAGSVKMVGPEGAQISPYKCETRDAFFQAKFYRKQAIAIIPDPKRGDSHEIQVSGNLSDGSTFSLKYKIKIKGKKEKNI